MHAYSHTHTHINRSMVALISYSHSVPLLNCRELSDQALLSLSELKIFLKTIHLIWPIHSAMFSIKICLQCACSEFWCNVKFWKAPLKSELPDGFVWCAADVHQTISRLAPPPHPSECRCSQIWIATDCRRHRRESFKTMVPWRHCARPLTGRVPWRQRPQAHALQCRRRGRVYLRGQIYKRWIRGLLVRRLTSSLWKN